MVLLDVPSKVIAKRMKTRQLDRFERAGDDFHARVLGGFAAMAAADPDHWAVVDASRSVAAVATDIRAIVRRTVRDLMASIWDAVVGQPRAVERLIRAADQPVHAYLFVGPAGSTKTQAARAFAALLIGGVDDPEARDARLALAGMHPDIREIERSGPAISVDQSREIVRLSSLAPIESDRKVMILAEFHLLLPQGAALLLKTIEEPPPSTIFIVLADFVPDRPGDDLVALCRGSSSARSTTT